MLKSSSCYYIDGGIFVKRTLTVPDTSPTAAVANNADKKVIFENYAPFTCCIHK